MRIVMGAEASFGGAVYPGGDISCFSLSGVFDWGVVTPDESWSLPHMGCHDDSEPIESFTTKWWPSMMLHPGRALSPIAPT